jgi:tRNA(Ile2) C34 agmatinyltransferase TiaS
MMEKVMKNTKLTSVKILESLYEKFKLNTVNTKMTLQKLTNRSVDRFLTDEKFREEIETYDNLTISGSNF